MALEGGSSGQRNESFALMASADGSPTGLATDRYGRPLMAACPDPSPNAPGRTYFHDTLATGTGTRNIRTVTAGKTAFIEYVTVAARRTTDVVASTLDFQDDGAMVLPFAVSGVLNEHRDFSANPIKAEAGSVLRFVPSDGSDSYSAVIHGYEL